MTGIYVLSIVIYKAGYWQKFFLIILIKLNKRLKIQFYCIHLSFSLTISLKIEYNKKYLLNA